MAFVFTCDKLLLLSDGVMLAFQGYWEALDPCSLKYVPPNCRPPFYVKVFLLDLSLHGRGPFVSHLYPP